MKQKIPEAKGGCKKCLPPWQTACLRDQVIKIKSEQMCRKYLYIIPLCLIFWPSAYAEGLRQEKPADSLLQERSVSGRVTDSERQPIPGAIITVVGTPRGVITDVDGTYEIVINNGEKLEFSAIGMTSQMIAAEPGTRIDVPLLPNPTD